MRALRRFPVRARLPEPLVPLGELVMNLRWSWNVAARDLFAAVDPDLWERTGHDPVRLLGEVGAQRLATLAADEEFRARLAAAADDLTGYLTDDRWYQTLGPEAPRCIAYFSMEYGITEVLPQYSGGLGILAGDHLKVGSDLGVPLVGVGLLYRAGYFVQSLSAEGWQQERYPPIDPHGLPLRLLPITVRLDLPEERTLHAQVWHAQVGRVPLLLLDSDVEENAPAERAVTDRLYGGGTDHRLLQELLLGVGGVRALRAFAALTGTPEPEVFHVNEGHAGFLGIERMRRLAAEDGLDVDTALAAVRAGTVFTTHTPVAAGIDRFPRELVAGHFAGFGELPVERILALGAEEDPGVFNMAHMGLRLAQRANGVSRLHGRVSREMFRGLWPGFDPGEVPIGAVTNGVHGPSWRSRRLPAGAAELDDAALWDLRRQARARLVTEIRHRLRRSFLQRGRAAAELAWVAGVFDPEVLTVGFARRVPSYKRLTLMLRDPGRLTALLLDPDRPMQLVIAGKAHPADDSGKELVQQIVQFADDERVRQHLAFLPDYDIALARHLYAGCDVWLNNPLRPLEACGTSGMKAALNGGLNLSIRDGWWEEYYDGSNGWAIPTADGVEDPDRRDRLEAAALYDLLEHSVKPRFYASDGAVPAAWVAMVRHTLASLTPKVAAGRMMREYVSGYYLPAAAGSRALAADGYAAAADLARYRRRVGDAWPQVAVRHAESVAADDTPQLGSELLVRAVVDLGGLAPKDVRAEVVYGRVTGADEIADATTQVLAPVGELDGQHRYEGAIPLDQTGPFGYTVRVLPCHAGLASPAEFGLVASV